MQEVRSGVPALCFPGIREQAGLAAACAGLLLCADTDARPTPQPLPAHLDAPLPRLSQPVVQAPEHALAQLPWGEKGGVGRAHPVRPAGRCARWLMRCKVPRGQLRQLQTLESGGKLQKALKSV